MVDQAARFSGVGSALGSRRFLLRGVIAGGATGLAGLRSPEVFAAGSAGSAVQSGRRAQGVSDAPWVALHGLDSDAYQDEYDRLVADGYRLRRISGYAIDDTAYFAAIWERSNGPDWVGYHGLTDEKFQAEYEELVGRGYWPTDISCYEIAGEVRFAGVFEEGAVTWDARYGLTGADFQATVDELGSAGLRPLRVVGYAVGGEEFYATIWEGDDGGPEWVTRHGLSSREYQKTLDELVADGFRPVDVSGYTIGGEEVYAAIFVWTDGRGWAARHGLDADDYRDALDELEADGLKPSSISAYNVDGEAAFAAVWEEPGVDLGGLDLADEIAQGAIDAAGVAGLSIAIAKDGELVYARAFGMADPEAGEATRPDHRFRIASISKPITAVAIMRLVESAELSLDDPVFGDAGILGNDYGTEPYSDDLESITVQHLMEHTSGGWTADDDPMYQRPEIAGDEFISWVLDTYPLVNTPGEVYAYSNFGYCLLGRVIEHTTGQPYDEYVIENVLAPCGISAMEIAGDTLADRRPDEVVYVGGAPYDLPVARMDANGGWLASATDLVRFAVRVDDFATVPDILDGATIAEMTTPSAAEPSYAKGWQVDDLGNWWHIGSLDGTSTVLVRTSDGFCWAALANGNGIDLHPVIWEMVNAVGGNWPAGDPP